MSSVPTIHLGGEYCDCETVAHKGQGTHPRSDSVQSGRATCVSGLEPEVLIICILHLNLL